MDFEPGLLLVAAVIGAIPTMGIVALGFLLRRSDKLTEVITATENQEKRLDRLEADVGRRLDAHDERLRQGSDKRERLMKEIATVRDWVAKEFIHREDYLRFVTIIETKQDDIFTEIRKINQRMNAGA